MATETLSFNILARDLASASFKNLGREASNAAGDVGGLSRRLNEVANKTARARVGLDGDRETEAKLDKIGERILRLSGRKVDPEVDLQGYLRTRAEITKLELQLDRLDAKRTRIHIAVDKAAGLGFLQPSALGAALSLLPALIPVAAQASAAVGAIGVSFGAAGAAAAGFGLLAGSVLSKVAENERKLQALNLKLNTATTAAQKKAIEQQIKTLTSSWSKGYAELVGKFQDFQHQWTHISQVISVPVISAWIDTLSRGLTFLKPALQPVADFFTGIAESLNAFLANNAGRVRDLAGAFGRFSATQLADVARFIKDIAEGVFNLGKDLAANGANFSAAGSWLAGIGDGFLTWSKSRQARDDVHGFMKFLHDEGPTIKGILKDLAAILPGIFKGATAVGTLELQALGAFLNLVAKLPKGWQEGLTEAAGALLLLSKLGVVKVGLKLTGWSIAGQAAGGAAEGAAGGGILAALQKSTGLKWVFRAGLAVALTELVVKPVLQSTSSGKGKNWWDNPFGTDKGKGALNSWKDLWHDIEHIFDTGRHWIAASWDATWQDTVGKAIRGGKTVIDSFKTDWHDIAHVFDNIRHGIATAWDTIWRNTVTRVRNGIGDVVGWFSKLPGRAIGALEGLGTMLWNFGHMALSKLWNGMKSVFSSVWGWFKSLPGKLLNAIGIKSPPDWAISAGRHIMGGILKGVISRKQELLGAWGGAIKFNPSLGVTQWGPLVRRALIMEGLNPLLAARVMYQMQTESGGNPRAINLTDSNAAAGDPSRGLMQVIGSTFRAYHWPGTSWNIYNPLANIAAALNYARHVYGPTLMNAAGQGIGSGRGYAFGTSSAARGWALVGERGPELVKFRGGEQVYPARAGTGRAGQRVVIEFRSGPGEVDQFLTRIMERIVRTQGGGDVQAAFGTSY